MEFVRICSPDEPEYGEAMKLYKVSFPEHEQRTGAAQRVVMGKESYNFDLICEDGSFVGDILYWESKDFIYVEHFCIVSVLRGKGLGKRALELLGRSGKTVILGIDPPRDSVSERRRDFYLRAGYRMNSIEHIHPPYRKEYDGHRLK